MSKVLTNQLRWVIRNDNRVLQQAWYYESSDEYEWLDVETVVESKGQ